MSDPEPLYLTTLDHGYVLTYNESGKPWPLTAGYGGDGGEGEKWLVEHGDEPDTIALKSVVDGKYITGDPKDRGSVSTTDTKQWWKMEHDGVLVRPPGSYRLHLVGSPKYFLKVDPASSIRPGQNGWRVLMSVWHVSTSTPMTPVAAKTF